MLQPHLNNLGALTWERVCAGWQSQDLQYYWKDLEMPVVPRDLSYSERGFAEALELAKQGDERARLHLQRASERDSASERAQAAAEVLEAAAGSCASMAGPAGTARYPNRWHGAWH